ncbi:hypothetical protein BCR36DRAFT_585051 [Piromyces finnis]|uniref:Uncharacterized protein n=1 Tax=Piromyces finnis TaxID=1754191 RepID=A0A1Y1V4C2_9FUNG|nr:hypothetical protein BCR36DRAFT_585051 [Piromyces finnis]|eukprot:ORX46938.1 hypothetical protein BCR36DRAFT_585051 [Piromyces finnis]
MKAALSTIEKNKKINKIFKIEPAPQYIKDIIINRHLKYLKSHPKRKRKLEAKVKIIMYNKQIAKQEEEMRLKKYMNIDIPDEIDPDINNDEIYSKQVKQLESLNTEENTLQHSLTINKDKIEELVKTIEDNQNKEIEYNKKQQEIFQKIEELKARKRKMFEMMKK